MIEWCLNSSCLLCKRMRLQKSAIHVYHASGECRRDSTNGYIQPLSSPWQSKSGDLFETLSLLVRTKEDSHKQSCIISSSLEPLYTIIPTSRQAPYIPNTYHQPLHFTPDPKPTSTSAKKALSSHANNVCLTVLCCIRH